MEESGAVCTDVNYVASQAWPFPQSSMVGFTATADMSRPLQIDTTELLDGKWFSKEAVAKAAAASVTMDPKQTDVILANDPTLELLVPAKGAIARHLIDTWLASH
jgi:NAD+ diphosphatase